MDDQPMNDGLPDNMDNWSEESFELIADMFRKIIEQDKKIWAKSHNQQTPTSVLPTPSTHRNETIQKDELINLRILLQNTNNVDDIIKNL